MESVNKAPRNFRISRYVPEYKTRLMDLLAYKWRGKDRLQIAQKFTWRYEANPHASHPHVYVAEENEVPAGFRAFILQKFILGNLPCNVFIPADAIVHPSYRRKGIFSQLNVAMLSAVHKEYPDNAFILNLTSNKMSRPGNLKQGWQLAHGQRRFHYAISRVNFWKSLLTKSNSRFQGNILFVEESALKYEISPNNYARELAALREKTRPENKFAGIRDEKYYTWRYSAPGAKYVFVYLRDNENLKAFLIVRKSKSTRYVLEEYYTPDMRTMKKLVSISMKYITISRLKTTSFSNSQTEMFRQAGFSFYSRWWDRFHHCKCEPVLVRPSHLKPEENHFFVSEKDVRDLENWQLYQADAY